MSVERTLRGSVMEWRLDAPPLNEIGSAMLAELEHALDELAQSDARALIVYSARPGGFCAGADLRELYAAISTREVGTYRAELAAFLDRVHAVMNRLDCLSIPTVGAVHGVCFGGGFELALTLDMLVADASARFCFPELRLGIVPGFGGIPRLRREMPNAVVRDLIMSGRSVNARKAAALGLVAHAVAGGEALAVARELAEQAVRFDAHAASAAKGFIKPLPEAELAREKELFLELFCRREVHEALRRFVESDDRMPYLPSNSRRESA